MVFILSKDFPKEFEIPELEDNWRNYRAYLASVKDKMPPSAHAFATAEWHYDDEYPQWPHDGDFEWIKTRVGSSGEWRDELWASLLKWNSQLHEQQPESNAGEAYEQWVESWDAANLEWRRGTTANSPSDNLDILIRVATREYLGVHLNGYLDLLYKRVHYYSLSAVVGDWRYDEVRLSDDGLVVHEIELGSGTHWLIECEDIETEWQQHNDPDRPV